MSELKRLAADLNAAAGRLPAKVGAAIQKAAFDVESGAKQRAPYDTGFLQNSIGTTIRTSSTLAEAEIGPTAHYGTHQEYGTYKMPAQPFMRPALEAVEPGLVKALEQVGIEALGG